MKTLSNARVRKIERIRKKLEAIQTDLYSFDNVNADEAAFELDVPIQMLEKAESWYEKNPIKATLEQLSEIF